MKSDLQFLEKELSYLLYGIFLNVGKELGPNFKEKIYLSALIKELDLLKLTYQAQPNIPIYSKNGDNLGNIIPDLLVEDKIIVEVKAVDNLLSHHVDQLEKYLEKSKLEIGYVVNFGSPYVQITRRIFSNDRKFC